MDRPPPLGRRFTRLAVPNILSNLTVPLAGLVDTAILGHLPDIRQLAGVSLGTVLFDYLFWGFGFLRMATTGLTAQEVGRRDRVAELQVALRGWVIAFAAGALLLLLHDPLRELGFALLAGGSGVQEAGRAYFDARIWGAPATLANFAFLGWFLGREQSRRALWIAVLGNGANVLLDWWFIVGLGWASAGAGYATALAQYLMLVASVAVTLREIPLARWREATPGLLDRAALARYFQLSGDITVRTLALISTFALFTNFAAAMGAVTLAATAVLRQVVNLAAFFIDGYAFATESLAGIFAGSGDPARLRRLLRLASLWGVGTGLAFAVAFLAAPGPLFSLLTDHPEALASIAKHRWWLLAVLLPGALAYILDGYFLGLTEGRILRWGMLASFALGFLPFGLWARATGSSQLLWLALALFMVARVLSLAPFVPPTLRRVARAQSSAT